MPAPFFDFYRSLIHDLRSSRRFQFATLLWIPLIITLGVLIVHFGQRHSAEEKYHEWKSTFIAESYITLPNLLIAMGNPNMVSANLQHGVNGQAIDLGQLTACPAPLNWSNGCLLVPTSQFQSHGGYGNDAERVAITMFFQPPGPPSSDNNTDIYVFAPLEMGWPNPTSSWTTWGAPVRSNDRIAVHLEPTHIWPMDAPRIAMWDTYVHYWSTQWADTSRAYNTSLHVRVPYAYVRATWESVPLNSWLLLAVWGGGITFFLVLHWLIFSCAKIAFLPDDSELLRGTAGSASGFEPIK